MGLMRVERWIDRRISSALARAFPSPLDLIELRSALYRECDSKASTLPGGRRLVPNEFAISLSPRDFRALETSNSLDVLKTALDTYIQERGYTLAGPIAVVLVKSTDQIVGLAPIRSAVLAASEQSDVADRVAVVIGTKRFALPEGVTSVGRDDSVGLRLDDVAVSRHHCDIKRSADLLSVHDRGSSNGTIVNGVSVTSAELRSGDVITVGSTELIIEVRQ